MQITRLFSISLLGLGLSLAAAPSAHALSLASMLHLHSHLSAASGPKAELQIKNPNVDFRDVQVADQVYTIRPNQSLRITAPVGTPIYAASKMFHKHAKGSLLTQMETGSHTLAVD